MAHTEGDLGVSSTTGIHKIDDIETHLARLKFRSFDVLARRANIETAGQAAEAAIAALPEGEQPDRRLTNAALGLPY